MKIYIINDIKIYDKIIIRKSDGNLLTKTHDATPDNIVVFIFLPNYIVISLLIFVAKYYWLFLKFFPLMEAFNYLK